VIIELENLTAWVHALEEQRAATGPIRYVHMMFNQMYVSSFIEFVNVEFSAEEHCFVIFKGFPHHRLSPPSQKNAYLVDSNTLVPVLDQVMASAQKVLIHGLFHGEILDYFLDHPAYLQRCYWSIWGGDVYQEAARPEWFLKKKRRFAQAIRGFIVGPNGDFDFVKALYGLEEKRCFHAIYVNPLGKKVLEPHRPAAPVARDPGKPVVVQINNSADPSIVEMLEKLHRFCEENIRIRVIASYGEPHHVQNALTTGSNLFGEKFEAIHQMLSPEAYAALLAQVDILVLNQPRQQGLGNTYAMLYLGKKVFVRRDITTWPFLRETYGIHLYDTLGIDTLSYEALVAQDLAALQQNRVRMEPFFDIPRLRRQWGAVFEDVLETAL
jgi:hypothetical protein